MFGVFFGPHFFYTYPNGDQVYNVSVVYQSSEYKGNLSSSEELFSVRFFAPDHLPAKISPPVQPIIQAWLEGQQAVRKPKA